MTGNARKRKTPREGNQLCLDLACAPDGIRRHGLRAAHPRPLVSDGKADGAFGSWRTTPARAWNHAEVEYGNAGSSYAAIVLDCDDPRRWRLAMADLPPPNFVIRRTANGHAHVAYTLARPVHRYPSARPGPLLRLAEISEYLTFEYGADPGFNGILCHNPAPRLKVEGYATEWGREAPYTLDGLAGVIPFRWDPPRVIQSPIGRNVSLFGSLMRWAGDRGHAELCCLAAAQFLNREFDHPLPLSEVKATARSVERYRARWAANGWHAPAWIEKKRRKGRAGGVASGRARREAAAERDRAIIEHRESGMKIRAIAALFGVPKSTVGDVVRRSYTDKGPESAESAPADSKKNDRAVTGSDKPGLYRSGGPETGPSAAGADGGGNRLDPDLTDWSDPRTREFWKRRHGG